MQLSAILLEIAEKLGFKPKESTQSELQAWLRKEKKIEIDFMSQ